jgi:hypothetical protein
MKQAIVAVFNKLEADHPRNLRHAQGHATDLVVRRFGRAIGHTRCFRLTGIRG